MIKLDNVEMTFSGLEETKVLENISFQIAKGDIVAIIGPSGAGKTTILNLISGLLTPTKGIVEVNGKIGYMFQEDNLLEWFNVHDNVRMGLKIQKKENEPLVTRLIEEYGLGDFIYKYPSQLSGGMRQRAALIRALVVDPDILLLDEPFSALDAQTKLTVAEEVKRIISLEGKTTILVTHDIHEALKFADYILVLSKRPSYIKARYHTNDNQDWYKRIWDDLKNEE